MPIAISSFFVPKNGNQYYLLEDVYLKGGYQIRPTIAARNAILSLNRKEGMLVYVVESGTIYKLGSDLQTWTELQLGGGGAAEPGYIEFTSGDILQNDFDIAEFEIGRTVMIQRLETTIPFTVEGFGNPNLVDSNPYKFVSTDDHLADDGTTLMSDGAVYNNRRYSFLSNDEPTRRPKLWFRLTNTSEVATSVTLKLWYLRIEE